MLFLPAAGNGGSETAQFDPKTVQMPNKISFPCNYRQISLIVADRPQNFEISYGITAP